MKFTNQETANILVALKKLRFIADNTPSVLHGYREFQHQPPMTPEAIDALCHKIEFSEDPIYAVRGPDGDINQDQFENVEDMVQFVAGWMLRYVHPGYYAAVGYKIPLSELPSQLRVLEIENGEGWSRNRMRAPCADPVKFVLIYDSGDDAEPSVWAPRDMVVDLITFNKGERDPQFDDSENAKLIENNSHPDYPGYVELR
jgi:hypothetical protein